MNNFATTVLATARKKYECILCTDPIWGGERCSKVVGRFNGRFFSVRYHINCISQSIVTQILLTETLPSLQKHQGNVGKEMLKAINTMTKNCSTCDHAPEGTARCMYCDNHDLWEPKREPSKQEIEAALVWGNGFLTKPCTECPVKCLNKPGGLWCGCNRRLYTAEWVEAYRRRKT